MFTPVSSRGNSYSRGGVSGRTGNRPFLYCQTPTIRRFGIIYSIIWADSWRNFAKVFNLVLSISMLIWASEGFLGTHKM